MEIRCPQHAFVKWTGYSRHPASHIVIRYSMSIAQIDAVKCREQSRNNHKISPRIEGSSWSSLCQSPPQHCSAHLNAGPGSTRASSRDTSLDSSSRSPPPGYRDRKPFLEKEPPPADKCSMPVISMRSLSLFSIGSTDLPESFYFYGSPASPA